jgi:hypothetical protein
LNVFFFAEHTRICSYCKKSIRGSTSKILSNNYGKHARTHGFSNAKAMDAHMLEHKQVPLAQALPPHHYDPPSDGGFGGGFEDGGFQDDRDDVGRAHDDERFR